MPVPENRRRCRYCRAVFYPRTGKGGSRQEFCCAEHRKNFWRYGGLPFDKLMSRLEREFRKIIRELVRPEALLEVKRVDVNKAGE
jgi:hypothetical protein